MAKLDYTKFMREAFADTQKRMQVDQANPLLESHMRANPHLYEEHKYGLAPGQMSATKRNHADQRAKANSNPMKRIKQMMQVQRGVGSMQAAQNHKPDNKQSYPEQLQELAHALESGYKTLCLIYAEIAGSTPAEGMDLAKSAIDSAKEFAAEAERLTGRHDNHGTIDTANQLGDEPHSGT